MEVGGEDGVGVGREGKGRGGRTERQSEQGRLMARVTGVEKAGESVRWTPLLPRTLTLP